MKISLINRLNSVSDIMSNFQNTGCTVLSIYFLLLTFVLLSNMIDSKKWLELETKSEGLVNDLNLNTRNI